MGFEIRATCAKSQPEDVEKARHWPLRIDEALPYDSGYPFQ
jgi:hypothetical protein